MLTSDNADCYDSLISNSHLATHRLVDTVADWNSMGRVVTQILCRAFERLGRVCYNKHLTEYFVKESL